MKKIVFTFVSIFTLLAFFTLLCLPAPMLFALDEDSTSDTTISEYTEIESSLLVGKAVALDYFNGLYVTDGINVIKSGDTETLIFQHNQTNTFYNIAASFDTVYCSQSNLYVEMYDTAITSIDRILPKDATELSPLSNSTKKIACDEFGNVYIIVDNTIGKVAVNESSVPITYYLDYFASLNEDQTFAGGGFCINEDGDTMYYSIGNNVYKVSITKTIVEIEPETDTNTDSDTTDTDDTNTDTTDDDTDTSSTDTDDAGDENNAPSDTPTQIIQTSVEINPIALNEFHLSSDNSFLTFNDESSIKSLRIDNIGNLYALSTYPVAVTDDFATYTVTYSSLYKCNLVSKKVEKIDYEFEIADICYDFCTGTTYAIINEPQKSEGNYVTNSNAVITLNKLVNLNTHGLVTNYLALTEKNYHDFITLPPTNACVTLANITNGTVFYDYCSLKTPMSICGDDKTIVILGKNEYNQYYYILDTNYALAPFYKLAYVPAKNIPTTFTPTQLETAESKIIVAKARLYNLPTSVVLTKTEDSITYAPNSGTLLRDTIVNVIELDSPLPLDHNSTPFVLVSTKIENQDVLVYMDKRTLISIAADTSLKIIHTSNATMRVGTTIYEDEACQVEKDYLSEGDKVTVLSKRHGIAKIQYYVGNEIKTGFVDKNLVDDGSLTTVQFISLLVALSCVIIAIVVSIIIRVRAKKRSRV